MPAVTVLSAGIQDVVLQRVGRLSDEAQQLLSLASVVGWRFSEPLLESAAARPADAVGRAIQEWLTRRLVQPGPLSRLDSLLPIAQYDFSHDKIRAVVYSALETARRRTLHGRVATALEEHLRGETGEQAGLLAHHWEQAEVLDKAAEYHARAGDRARLAYGHEEAIAHYKRALDALRKQGQHTGAGRMLMKLGLTYHNAFDFRRAREAYDESFSLWQRSGTEWLEDAPSSEAQGWPGQTLRVRWIEPVTLDPALVPDADTGHLAVHLFSGLIALRPDLDVVPDVARAWELSEGGRRFVFHLRRDVTWTDGTPVTAMDFEYAWKRVLDPHTRSPAAGLLQDLRGAKAFHSGDGCEEDVAVEAIDDVTLAVELERPVGYFLQILAHAAFRPVPRHVVEAHGARWMDRDFVTNGPFRLEAWDPGECLILSRNLSYHSRLGGNVERIEVSFIADWSERLALYDLNRLDVLGIGYVPSKERERVRQAHPTEYVSGPRLETCYLAFDVNRPPLDDVRVRRALALAADRETLADAVLQGYVSPAAGGFVPPGMLGHSSEIGLPYDPDGARQLLAEAGYPDGRGFPVLEAVVFDAVRTRGEYLQEQWHRVLGVETEWDVLSWAAFLERLSGPAPRILCLMWAADYPDPDDFLRVCRRRTWPGWQNRDYDQLVREAREACDPEQRMGYYRKADLLLVEEVPILPLTYEREHLLVKPWVSRYPTSATQAAFWKDAVIRPHESGFPARPLD